MKNINIPKKLIAISIASLGALTLSTAAVAAKDASATFSWKGSIPAIDTQSGARIINKGIHDFSDGFMQFRPDSSDDRHYELNWAQTFMYSVQEADSNGVANGVEIAYDTGIENAYLTTVVAGGGLRTIDVSSAGSTCDTSTVNDICVMADGNRISSAYVPDGKTANSGGSQTFYKAAGEITSLTLQTPGEVEIFGPGVAESDIPNAWVYVQAAIYVDADI